MNLLLATDNFSTCLLDTNKYDGLYKFYSYTEDNHKFHKSLLDDGLLYHSPPSGFNDPFECKPFFRWPESADEYSAFETDLAYLSSKLLNRTEEQTLESLNNFKLTAELKNNIEQTLENKFRKFRISCFTTSNRNLLFWAHYAKSHTGFCVKFSSGNKVIDSAHKIHYSETYPELDFPIFSELHKLIIPVLCKSIEWKYESEYRTTLMIDAPMQLPNNGESLILDHGIITDIYFGVAMDEGHKKNIINLVNNNKFNPKFWNARAKKKEYGLNFEPY